MRLWWGRRENVDLLAFEQGLVCFQADKLLKTGKVLKAKAHLPGGETFQALLKVVEPIPPSPFLEGHVQALGYAPKRYYYHGEVEEPQRVRSLLSSFLEPLPSQQVARRGERVSRGIRVRSQDLLRYHATARDLSISGICLVAEGPLEVGRQVNLRLEFDGMGFTPLDVQAQVRWCRPHDARASASHVLHSRFLVGACFLSLLPADERRLTAYVAQAAQVQPGILEHDDYSR